MANICLYKIKVKGTQTACHKLVHMMPLYSWEKEELYSEGTESDFTLIFLGACKWSVDCYTEKVKDIKPFTEEELNKIEDGDGWNYTLQDKSILLNCEIFCNSKDIDDCCYASYVHYNKGKQIFDECPKELHIKRGRDYDMEYEIIDNMITIKEEKTQPSCKVRFEDNRSYWYLGDFEIGDLIYVDGAKEGCLGKVIETSTTSANSNMYEIITKIGHVGEFFPNEIEEIWNSFKAKERKIYLASIGFDTNITKKKFITLMENKWNDFAQEDNDWNNFKKTLLPENNVLQQ
ncbi:MAG: hypothetical protein IKJ01_00840 [Lachnospiraceae bacterium]|nr:hypothetical protein [Lachnospiraceae bacterium]